MFECMAAYVLPVLMYMLVASCKGTLAIALVLVCRKMLEERLSAQARHGLWLAALAALLLPVGFNVPIALPGATPSMVVDPAGAKSPAVDIHVDAGADTAPLAAPALPETGTRNAATGSTAGDTPAGTIPFRSWLAMLWAAVAVLLAAIPVLKLFRYRRIAARAIPLSGPCLDLLLECRMLTGLRRDVRVRQSADIATPAVFGWLSPMLLLPPGLHERLGEAQLRHVFLHELAHVRRHDILVSWIAACAQILHWFNPVVWYGMRMMRSDMEQACDAKVLGLLSPAEHADYGRTLINVLDEFPGPAPVHGLGVIESRQLLKERIMRIAKFSSRQAQSPVLAMVLLLALASVAATQPQITSRAPERAIERAAIAAIKAPSGAAVLMSQAGQPVPAAPPAATAVPRQPSTDAGHAANEVLEATRAFTVLGVIARSGPDDDTRQNMSLLGLYPEDPRTLLPAVNHLMDEYRNLLDEGTAALCQRKDVTTTEMFTDVMRESKAEQDSWQVRKWQEFLASLPVQDRTPRDGEPRRFWMNNVRLGTGNPLSFNQGPGSFIEWRERNCQVATATDSARNHK